MDYLLAVAYAVHTRDNYLWKIDSDAEELWRWQADTDERVSRVAIGGDGNVYVEFPITPEVPPNVTLNKGEYPPMDQMFYTLDASGVQASERRYELAFDFASTGPAGFLVTPDGNILSANGARISLFDPNGESLWAVDEDSSDAQPYYVQRALSLGRCTYCAYNSCALYAFDADGQMFESLTLPEGRYANFWSVDDADNVYAFLPQEGASSVVSVIKFPDGAGWQPTPTP